MTSRKGALGAGLILALLALPGEADAYERQWHVGLGLGYSYLSDTSGGNGFGGGLYMRYGLSDPIDFMLELDYTVHPGGERMVGSASAGALWVFDVFQVVGYLGAMAGAYDRLAYRGPCADRVDCDDNEGRIGFSPVLGVDYLLSRNVSIGVQGRYHLLVLGGDPPEHYVTAFAVTEYVWGY